MEKEKTPTGKEKTPTGKPDINIGFIGHVSHGKTQTIKALSGITTTKFKKEKERNITIKLGYANALIETPTGIRNVSFVDAPGHDAYMSTMISGSSVMDAVILIIAANEKCPQPQTQEHLRAIEITRNNIDSLNIIIIQNKIDLVSIDEAEESYQDIKKFVKGTIAENAPIIPTCAAMNIGMDVVKNYIVHRFRVNSQQELEEKSRNPIMTVVRSFDINRGGSLVKDMKGGVLGGTVVQGLFEIGDSIEIKHNDKTYITTIQSMFTEKTPIEKADRGGLIAIGTLLDPSITISDGLIGATVFKTDIRYKDWKEYTDVIIEYTVFERSCSKKLPTIEKKDILYLNCGSNVISGKVSKIKENKMKVKLDNPIFVKKNAIVAISKPIENKLRLIGYAIIKD